MTYDHFVFYSNKYITDFSFNLSVCTPVILQTLHFQIKCLKKKMKGTVQNELCYYWSGRLMWVSTQRPDRSSLTENNSDLLNSVRTAEENIPQCSKLAENVLKMLKEYWSARAETQKSGRGQRNGNHPLQINESCEKLQPWIIARGSGSVENETVLFYGSDVEEVNAFQSPIFFFFPGSFN